MTEFKVSLSSIKSETQDILLIYHKLNRYMSALNRLQSSVKLHSVAAGRKINNVCVEVEKAAISVESIADALLRIVDYYDKAEMGIVEQPSNKWDIAKELSVLGRTVAISNSNILSDKIKWELGTDEYYNNMIALLGNALHAGLLSKEVFDRTKALIGGEYLSKNNFLVSSVIQEASGFIKDSLEPFENVQNIIQWLEQDDEIKIPLINEMIDCVKTIDLGIDLIRGFEDFVVGMTQNDSESLAKGGKELTKSMMKYLGKIKWTKQDNVIAPDILNPVKLLGSYATNMITGFIDGITDENPTMQRVVYETFIDSGLNVSVDAVVEAANAGIVLVHAPISWVADKFGVDLNSVYEKHSDKKGVFAAIDNVSQVADMIKENSSWESWNSGLKLMGKGIKNGVEKLFS